MEGQGRDAAGRGVPVRDMVDGELQGLALAAEQHTRVTHIGGQQLGGPPLPERQRHSCSGAALGSPHSALPHPPEEAALRRQQLLVRLMSQKLTI